MDVSAAGDLQDPGKKCTGHKLKFDVKLPEVLHFSGSCRSPADTSIKVSTPYLYPNDGKVRKVASLLIEVLLELIAHKSRCVTDRKRYKNQNCVDRNLEKLKIKAILYNWKTADWIEVGLSLNSRAKGAENKSD